MGADRMDRVNREIVRVLGRIIREEAGLPADVLTTVTGAEATRNLRGAKVWLSVYPKERREEIFQKLEENMYELQGSFNRNIELHPLPRLQLLIDEGPEQAEKVERKLYDIHRGEI